jgi:hypothetical protein
LNFQAGDGRYSFAGGGEVMGEYQDFLSNAMLKFMLPVDEIAIVMFVFLNKEGSRFCL